RCTRLPSAEYPKRISSGSSTASSSGLGSRMKPTAFWTATSTKACCTDGLLICGARIATDVVSAGIAPFTARRFRLQMLDPLRVGRQGLPLFAEAQGQGTDRARGRPQLVDEAHQGLLQFPRFRVEVCEGLQQAPFQLEPDRVRGLIAKPLTG